MSSMPLRPNGYFRRSAPSEDMSNLAVALPPRITNLTTSLRRCSVPPRRRRWHRSPGQLGVAQPLLHHVERYALADRLHPEAVAQALRTGMRPVRDARRGDHLRHPPPRRHAKLRLAQAAMGRPETKIAPLCRELGITRQTLYRH